jgi:hypothetical protein
MIKRIANIRRLRAATGDDAPVRAKPKRQLRRQGQDVAKGRPLLGKLQGHQQQERLVRRRVAACLINFQVD